MCGTENEAAAGQATNGNGTTPAQHQMSATSPYQRIEDYLSNVGRYKIIESMENLPKTEQWGVQPFARRKLPPLFFCPAPNPSHKSDLPSQSRSPNPSPEFDLTLIITMPTPAPRPEWWPSVPASLFPWGFRIE